MKKRILSVLLILCVLLGMVACGDKESDSKKKTVEHPADWDVEAELPRVKWAK